MISIRTILRQNPNIDAEIILSYVLNKTRSYLFAHPEKLLSSKQYSTYQDLMIQRAQGVPIAYLIGEREFWSIPLKVNRHTLIPRHETELLVELALKYLLNQPNACILELGTGSGAISLALGKERPNWQIFASDISQEALSIAQENARANKINNVAFYHSNWFDKVPKRHYHAIIANPPYLAEQDSHLQKGDLRFEPKTALVSSQEGLADLQCIISQGHEYLFPNGLLLVEHGYEQQLKVHAIFKELGYKNLNCWQDIQGHDRVSGGWR